MRWMILTTLLVLGGCGVPDAEFRGIAATRISIDRSTFDVRVKGHRAEAIRVNSEYAPRLAAVAPRGVAAIELVSGCYVYRIGGDQAQLRAWLSCDGTSKRLPQEFQYDCEFEPTNDDFGDLICGPLP